MPSSLRFAAAAGIHAEDARRLRTIVEGLLNFTLDNAYPDDDLGEIEVTLEVVRASPTSPCTTGACR
jgi:hypothetical protein